MNGVRDLTLSDWHRKAMPVQTKFGVRFILTGAYQYTHENFTLLPICNSQIVCVSYFGV